MNAYIFPGQGAQFAGMGLDLYEKSPLAQELFEKAKVKIVGVFLIGAVIYKIGEALFKPPVDKL